MPLWDRRTIPNAITVARIVVTPVLFLLILTPGFWPRLLAFLLFLAAAISDIWDGYLARKHGWISDFGKLMDPIADKLLLVASFVPFYILSHRLGPRGDLPYWGELPLWVLIVVFGRELVITLVRAYAARQGRVIPAGPAGKHKAIFQSVFMGAAILWFALESAAAARGWTTGLWEAWAAFHGAIVGLSLLLAVVWTVWSMLVYLYAWRGELRQVS